VSWLLGHQGAAWLGAFGDAKDGVVQLVKDAVTARMPGTGRTNLLISSGNFAGTVWSTQRSTVTANAAVAPDGTTTASALTEDTTANSNHYVSQWFIKPAYSIVTFSVWAKYNGRGLKLDLESSGGGAQAGFDLQAGTYVGPGAWGTNWSVLSAAVAPAGNGWYRCSVTVQTGPETGVTCIPILVQNGTLTDGYTGNGTYGILLWGAQAEYASAPTAYIPTTTAVGYAPGPNSAPSDALGSIGTERGIARGLTEPESAYRARLQNAMTLWPRAGTAYGLLSALYAAGYPNPIIQTQSGRQYSLLGYTGNPASDLSASTLPSIHLGGTPAELWSDIAVFISQPWPSWWSTTAPADGSTDQQTVAALVKAWKGAHNRCVQLKAIKGPVVGVGLVVGSFTVGSGTVTTWTPPVG
jgi:hypothetical protein